MDLAVKRATRALSEYLVILARTAFAAFPDAMDSLDRGESLVFRDPALWAHPVSMVCKVRRATVVQPDPLVFPVPMAVWDILEIEAMPVCPEYLDVPELLVRRETWARSDPLVLPDLLVFLVLMVCVDVMAPRVSPAVPDWSACPVTKVTVVLLEMTDPRALLALLVLPESADLLVFPEFPVSFCSIPVEHLM